MKKISDIFNRIIPFTSKIHLAVVYVEYDRKKNPSSDQVFSLLQKYLSVIQKCRITYLRVDNKHENLPFSKIDDSVYQVGGDNRFREFSGWQRGREVLDSMGCAYNVLLITNEMFLKPGPSFLQDYASHQLLERALHGRATIGRIDSCFKEFELFGYDVSHWVCTNCVVIPRPAVDALVNFVLMNDNLHEILPRQYPPGHLLARHFLQPDPQSGQFSLAIDIETPHGQETEVRVKFNANTFKGESRIAQLKEILVNGIPLPPESFLRGITQNDSGALHANETLLLALPKMDAAPASLAITGTVRPELCKKFESVPSVMIYNDTKLFQPDAAINRVYQRWIVEWLTERWHSRFDLSSETWELFKTKAAAIFNEALLTAKFKELGYPPESYGDRKYY